MNARNLSAFLVGVVIFSAVSVAADNEGNYRKGTHSRPEIIGNPPPRPQEEGLKRKVTPTVPPNAESEVQSREKQA